MGNTEVEIVFDNSVLERVSNDSLLLRQLIHIEPHIVIAMIGRLYDLFQRQDVDLITIEEFEKETSQLKTENSWLLSTYVYGTHLSSRTLVFNAIIAHIRGVDLYKTSRTGRVYGKV